MLVTLSQPPSSGTIATRHACFAAVVTPVIYRYATQSVENQRFRLPRACQIGRGAWADLSKPSSFLLWFLAECVPALLFQRASPLGHPRLEQPPRDPLFYSSRAVVASLQPLVMIILRSRSGSAGTRLPDIYFLGQEFRTVTPTEHCNPHCASMADGAGVASWACSTHHTQPRLA